MFYTIVFIVIVMEVKKKTHHYRDSIVIGKNQSVGVS